MRGDYESFFIVSSGTLLLPVRILQSQSVNTNWTQLTTTILTLVKKTSRSKGSIFSLKSQGLYLESCTYTSNCRLIKNFISVNRVVNKRSHTQPVRYSSEDETQVESKGQFSITFIFISLRFKTRNLILMMNGFDNEWEHRREITVEKGISTRALEWLA